MFDDADRIVGRVVDLQFGDHVCAVYSSRHELDSIVVSYVDSAAAADRKPMFLDRERALVLFGDRPATDPDGLVADFEHLANDAVAEGYTGLAVLSDATELVLTAESRLAFARVEHLADRMVRSTRIVTGLCVYDGRELGAEAVAELGVLHQQLLPNDTSFHLCGAADGLHLDGELDINSVDLLEGALTAVTSATAHNVVVDVSDLAFIDHRSLQVLDRYAAAHDQHIELHHARPIVQRLAGLIQARHVTAVTA